MSNTTNYAKDSLGRSTGRVFNMAAMKREILAKINIDTEEYRGFKIERGGKHVFVVGSPKVYATLKAAKAGIDACLETRALVAEWTR